MKKCKLFLQKCEKFKWFIVCYFGQDYYDGLVELAQNNDWKNLNSELNNVWFELPDSIFNIIENPEGWSEFLEVIEE